MKIFLYGLLLMAFTNNAHAADSKVTLIRGENTLRIENIQFKTPQYEIVPAGQFDGTWKFKFTLLDDTKTEQTDGPKPWLDLFFEIDEKDGELVATISLAEEFQEEYCPVGMDLKSLRGKAKARLDDKNSKFASGKMKMCWDAEYWPVFDIDLERNLGRAIHRTIEGFEHHYTFKIERVDISPVASEDSETKL